MHLNFCNVNLTERTSQFCIFTNCLNMAAASCFMGPINIFVFQSDFWIILIVLQITSTSTFVTKINSIKLILLWYNIYLCKFSLLYLFEYLINILLIGRNTGIVPNRELSVSGCVRKSVTLHISGFLGEIWGLNTFGHSVLAQDAPKL